MALAKINESMAHSANKYCYNVWFHSGDLVNINTAHFSLASGLFMKLAPKLEGPFPIDWVIPSVVHRVSLHEKHIGIFIPCFMFCP